MTTVTVEQASKLARPGDIVIVFDDRPKAKADGIEWFDHGGNVIHACLAIDAMGRVVQATAADGVMVCGLIEVAPEDSRAVVRRPRASEEDKLLMVACALRMVAVERGRASSPFRSILNILLPWRWGAKRRAVPATCVGLIAHAARVAGMDLGLSSRARRPTPADLLFTPSLDTVGL